MVVPPTATVPPWTSPFHIGALLIVPPMRMRSEIEFDPGGVRIEVLNSMQRLTEREKRPPQALSLSLVAGRKIRVDSGTRLVHEQVHVSHRFRDHVVVVVPDAEIRNVVGVERAARKPLKIGRAVAALPALVHVRPANALEDQVEFMAARAAARKGLGRHVHVPINGERAGRARRQREHRAGQEQAGRESRAKRAAQGGLRCESCAMRCHASLLSVRA